MAAWAQQSGLANAALLAAFGSSVSYQPAGGDSFTVTGIVDQTSDEERQANGVYARLFVQLADFAAPPTSGDEVTIGSAIYTVFNVANDSGGGCWLSLREKI